MHWRHSTFSPCSSVSQMRDGEPDEVTEMMRSGLERNSTWSAGTPLWRALMPPPTQLSERASVPDMLRATNAEAMRPNFRLRMTNLLNSLVGDGVASSGHGD